MTTTLTPDIAIIGAGAGGLTVAAVASQLGKEVVLIEEGKMGGDCLNTGCVPSKALLACAHAVGDIIEANRVGIEHEHLQINFATVMEHVRATIATIAPHDSQERFEGLGATVLRETASFVDNRTLKAGDTLIKPKKIVIATGSHPFVPPIPGVEHIEYFTNETIFDLKTLPEHLIIIGAGPIGCEMAQAFRLLGANVSVIDKGTLLPRDEPECVAIVRETLTQQGIFFYEAADIEQLSQSNSEITVALKQGSAKTQIKGSHLLISAGRKASIKSLQLQNTHINHANHAITIDKRCRTNLPHIYAIGDVSGPFQFTHMAGYQAGIVIKNLLFKLPAKADYSRVPWVTYVAPELAHVGLTEKQAREKSHRIHVFTEQFGATDRAIAENRRAGLIKIVCDHKLNVLGVSLCGHMAGEMITPWTMLINKKLSSMSDVIVPYPTYSDIHKKIVSKCYGDKLYSKKTKRLVKWLSFLG